MQGWFALVLMVGCCLLQACGTSYPDHSNAPVPAVNIILPEKSLDHLEDIREEALDRNILITTDDSYVEGILEVERKGKQARRFPMSLRLKGDWTDHLYGEKWSFRVKLRNKTDWEGREVFSLQSPERRYFLSEWLYHQWLAKEGVLTPSYDFITLKLNGQARGLYVVEGHFDGQLIKSQGRPPGVIVKFDETGLWNCRTIDIEVEKELPVFEATPIGMYEDGKVLGDPQLRAWFLRAQDLLYAYKYNLLPADSIFDVDLLAKYYAITDVMTAYHCAIYHNWRFYYNPTIDRLEIIAFDGFDFHGPYDWHHQPYLSMSFMPPQSTPIAPVDGILYHTFSDTAFMARYRHHLLRFSDEAYLNALFKSLEQQMKANQALLLKEFKESEFQKEDIMAKATKVRELVQGDPTAWMQKYVLPKRALRYREQAPKLTEAPLADVALIAYVNRTGKRKMNLQVTNYYHEPLEVIGTGYYDFEPDKVLEEPMVVQPFGAFLPPKVHLIPLKAKGDPGFVFYKVQGKEPIYVQRVFPWPAPQIK